MKKPLILLVLFIAYMALWLGVGGFPSLAHRTTKMCFPVVQILPMWTMYLSSSFQNLSKSISRKYNSYYPKLFKNIMSHF